MSIKSPFGDVTIPTVPLHQIFLKQFIHHGDNIALVNGTTGEQLSYKTLHKTICQVSKALVNLGIKPGDVVALYSYNSPQWVCMFWGVICAGATVMTVNPLYTKYELLHQLKDADVKFVFTVEKLADNCLTCANEVKSLKKIICCGSVKSGCLSYDSLIKDDDDDEPNDPKVENQTTIDVKEAIALIIYSSGTTGVPKGVLLTHYNIVANFTQLGLKPTDENAAQQESSNDKSCILAVLPLYHSYGLMVMCMSLAEGDKVVTLPNFEPHTFLSAISKYKVTGLPLVPPIVNFLSKSPLVNKYDLSSIKDIICGGAPLSEHAAEEFKSKLHRDTDMGQGYGMTETTAVACSQSSVRKSLRGSCGTLLPSTEAKIIDLKTQSVLGPNETGEILLRGPQIMKGYLNQPESTRLALDNEGWLHTGDVGYYDTDYNFFVVDRIKELIKVKGYQVAPAELESVLINHPSIADAAVTGIPDQRAGELPRAFVVKCEGTDITETQIQTYVSGIEKLTSFVIKGKTVNTILEGKKVGHGFDKHDSVELLAPYKHLKGGVKFVEEIPKLPSGKILRRKLKEM